MYPFEVMTEASSLKHPVRSKSISQITIYFAIPKQTTLSTATAKSRVGRRHDDVYLKNRMLVQLVGRVDVPTGGT